MEVRELWNIGLQSIEALEDERGILASGRDEVYGCVFGRDSLITSLTLLRVYEEKKNPYFLTLVRKVLHSLSELQGKEHNLESGEEPGKCIHEFRPDNHQHLTDKSRLHEAHDKPWYVYDDDVMRNYDTVDATPLFLMLFHEYYRITGDRAFIDEHKDTIILALHWLLNYADTNGDGFIDYRFHTDRTMGGLQTQSWMDSTESVFYEKDQTRPAYPLAPVEVQAYAFVAMRAWGDSLADIDASLAERLVERAYKLKEKFNNTFVIKRGSNVSLAYALDGDGNLLTSPRSSMGHVLWAAYKGGSEPESIFETADMPALVRRLMAPDLFVPQAGIRTLSMRSTKYDPMSYHNGSIWPHDTAILVEGLEQFGFIEEAARMRQALLSAFTHFKTPIELFGYSGGKFREYETSSGGRACRVQAWSAASLLSMLRGLDISV